MVVDKQQQRRIAADGDETGAAAIVGRAVQTLYKRLNGGVAGSATGSAKKAPSTAGHRVRTASNGGGGDDYDDAAALTVLTGAVVEVTIGGAPTESSSSPARPAGSDRLPNDGKSLTGASPGGRDTGGSRLPIFFFIMSPLGTTGYKVRVNKDLSR